MKKITDLEKFTLEHIVRPYQNMHDCWGDKRLRSLPIHIDEMPKFIKDHPEWWALVSDRIKRIGFTFPTYLQHPIVNIVNNL